MDTSLCGDALHLLDGYYAALTAFHKEREHLDALTPAESDWEEATQSAHMASVRLAVMRREYWSHVESHGCRQTGDLTDYLVGQLALAG